MANNGSLQQILENPSRSQNLDNNQIQSIKPSEDSFCFEIFGELHFKEIHEEESSSSSFLPKNDWFSFKKLVSLQNCTERLGFESINDYVEESKNNDSEEDRKSHEMEKKKEKVTVTNDNLNEFRKSKTSNKCFPPPISCLGRSGKPRVCLKSFRHGGRLILKEIKFSSQKSFHACREDGTLKLQYVQPVEEIPQEKEEQEVGSIKR